MEFNQIRRFVDINTDRQMGRHRYKLKLQFEYVLAWYSDFEFNEELYNIVQQILYFCFNSLIDFELYALSTVLICKWKTCSSLALCH